MCGREVFCFLNCKVVVFPKEEWFDKPFVCGSAVCTLGGVLDD